MVVDTKGHIGTSCSVSEAAVLLTTGARVGWLAGGLLVNGVYNIATIKSV